MKKALSILTLTLAINFLAVAGAVGWLFQQGKLDRARIDAIKEIMFPKPAVVAAPTSQPAPDPTTQPMLRLEELLVKTSGRPASEQMEVMQHTFDAQLAILDRRQRELTDLQRQIDLAKQQATKDEKTLKGKETALETREQEANRLATDKGFQDSLTLYNSMPSKQVKTIFMGLTDATVMNYLKAMQPRTASKIIKEFKTPEETDRIQKILEQMRTAQASAKE